jgi:hypothetical protein
MKPFSLRRPEVDAASPDEPDFPLQVADPSIRPMHRECVLGGCLYRSRFLFNAGWALAVAFLLATALSVLYSVRTNDANEALLDANEVLLKENMLLLRNMAAQREKLAELSARASATPPAEKGPDKAVSPPKAAPEPRRAVPPPKRSPQNAVPESEKWWNRP